MAFYSAPSRYSSAQLGDLYEHRLGLQRREVTWLNKFITPSSPFLQIPVARDATVRLYLAVMNELEKRCKQAGSSLQTEARELEEHTEQHIYISRWSQSFVNRKWAGHKVAAAVYLTIFLRCENAVRARYDTQPTDDNNFFAITLGADYSFEEYFGNTIRELLPPLALTVPPPDQPTEQALNQGYPERWKPRFERLLALLPARPDDFAAGVYRLGEQNQRNPFSGLLYLQAAQQLGELGHEKTIGLYLHYLHRGNGRYPFKIKPLLKRVQKKLFPLPEHLARFERICEELLRKRDLTQALVQVPDIYYKERKKIELDKSAIHAVRDQHAGTVELLNEYLRDEPPPAPRPTEKAPALPRKKAATATPSKPAKVAAATPAATFAASLTLSVPQQELLLRFAANALTLPQAEVEAFAGKHGTLRHQLIDGLNDACYELLDDVLIEENDTAYTIYEPHYRKILA